MKDEKLSSSSVKEERSAKEESAIRRKEYERRHTSSSTKEEKSMKEQEEQFIEIDPWSISGSLSDPGVKAEDLIRKERELDMRYGKDSMTVC